jgi:hypothetical protein
MERPIPNSEKRTVHLQSLERKGKKLSARGFQLKLFYRMHPEVPKSTRNYLGDVSKQRKLHNSPKLVD